MAVIREDRKFGIQPIGVVKASRGGEIIANAVTKSAEQIGQMAYKVGARQAEKSGTEAAMAAPNETIIGFDPETGNPTALNELSKMGTIRADAYERIVLRRFEQSMEEELRNKSSEIAMQNQDEGTYNNLFSTYIAGMAENATGLYKEYITNTGSVIQGRTALALREQAIRRAQAQAKAEADAAQARNEGIAFANGAAGGPPSFEPLVQISTESGQDVATFTGETFNLSEAEQNIRYNDAFGYSMGQLGNLTATERNSYLAWLRSGGTFVEPVSDRVQALQARALNAFGADAAKLVDLSKDISSSVTAWNGFETQPDRDAAAASNLFATSTLELNRSLSEQGPLNTARSDFNAAIDLVDQYGTYDIGELNRNGDSTGAIGSRDAAVVNLRGQVSTGIVAGMLDDTKLTIEQIQDIQNQLQNGNSSGLIAAYRAENPLDEATATRIADLLKATDPAVYTAQLDDAVQFIELKQERATAAADAIFSQMDADRLVTSVMDGTKTASEALDEIPEASSIADATFTAISEASRTSSLVQFLNRENADQPFSTDLADELARAAISLKDFNEANYPNIFARNLQDKVQSVYTGLAEETRRQTVSRMLASLPNADAITIATHSANADQISESISKLTTNFGSMDADQIISEAANLRGRLDENGALESGDRSKLLGELNSQVAEVILSRELTKLDDATAKSIAEFIGSDASNEKILSVFSGELGQTIVDAISGLDTDQRDNLRSSLILNVNGNINARVALNENERITAITNQLDNGSGVIIGVESEDDINEIVNNRLIKYGIVNSFGQPSLTSVPVNLFTNYGYWSSAENPDANMRQFAIDMAGLARRGVLHPQLADAFRGLTRGRLGDEEASNILSIYAGVSQSLTPSDGLTVRNIIVGDAGLNAEEIGILDSMTRLRSAGSSWDTIRTQLTANTQAARSRFETTYGVSPEQLAKDAANRGLLTTGVWENNAGLQELWTDYVIGLSASGSLSRTEIEQQASQFIKGNFVEDPFVTKFGAPNDRLTNIPFVRSFPSQDAALSAMMISQIQAFEAFGREMNPSGTREEQIATGRQYYSSNSNLISPLGPNLSLYYGMDSYSLINGDIDLRGKTALTFVSPEFSNPSDPTFYLSTINQNGGVDVLAVDPISPRNPIYQRGASVLSQIRGSDSTNHSRSSWDAMIEFYLGAM